MIAKINSYIDSQIKTLQDLHKSDTIIEKIGKKLLEARSAGNTIYIMGNGGSASTASHMACDMLKSCIDSGQNRFKAVSLTDNMAVFSAWANDVSYDHVFSEQLKNFLTEKDLVIAISGSGNSKNIINAVEFANKIGAYTIGLTGMGGGKLAKVAKLSLIVPNDNMWRVEDIHLLLNHLLVSVFLGTNTSRLHMQANHNDSMRKALFIDRDNTINHDAGYVYRISDLKIFPEIPTLIRKYKRMGYLVIVLTNQSGIGRGHFTEADMKAFNTELNRRLEKAGAGIDAFYWCPHHPKDNCDCRKPKTTMVDRAKREFGIDLKKSILIGDNDKTDGELARRLRMKYIILERAESGASPDCGIVLAGGKGMRLRPITTSKPKPLVAVEGKPVIAHVIDNMIRNGISDVIVCTGYKDKMIKSYVSRRYKGKANVTFSHGGDIDTGSRVRLAVRELKPNQRAIAVAFGDDVNDVDYKSMYAFHKQNRASITLAIKHVNNSTGFGLVRLTGKMVKKFVEKPEKPTSGYVNVGIIIFSREAFRYFPAKKDFNLTKDFLEGVARKNIVQAYISKERWYPIDTPERYRRAERILNEK